MSKVALASSAKKKAYVQIVLAALVAYFPFWLGWRDTGSILFFLIPALLLAYMSFTNYRYIAVYNSYESYFNERGDGIFHHYLNNGTYIWEMYINTNNETVRLQSNGKRQTFRFDEIKGAEYFVNSYSGSAGLTPDIEGPKSFRETGFFVTTKDLKDPEWHIRLIAENMKVNMKSSAFYTDINRQCDSWINVYEQVVFKTPE